MEKTHEKKIDQVLQKLIIKMVKNEVDEWPPTCGALLFQPKRPDMTIFTDEKTKP